MRLQLHFHLTVIFILLMNVPLIGQHSVARQWNEVLLNGIRNDFARPTIHARNLFHTSVAMYDAWAAYDETAEPFFLGKTIRGYSCEFKGIAQPQNIEAARNEAISYAAYRLLKHRFRNSPGANETQLELDSLFAELGYDSNNGLLDYESGSPAHLGNYIAHRLIEFGFQDGANELEGYTNRFYEPVNFPLYPPAPGNPDLSNFNRWQPLTFGAVIFIDQSGNPLLDGVPKFLSPEWGNVVPFALTPDDLNVYQRDGNMYWVYHDPGLPPQANFNGDAAERESYQWNFSLVALWSSHLDPSDGVMWDISPASIGNINSLPTTFAEYKSFYNSLEGGDPGVGHSLNPQTGEPYEPQWVPRGDYTRVLAEFWADGPDSETPPGHWYTVLNYVSDHPELEKRFKGTGPILGDLEWDIKSYLALGGAVHDAAISAWGIKGWYDYIRPISSIRGMAMLGQSSDPSLAKYNEMGIPLEPGYIEVVEAGDPLAGAEGEHIGKIKLLAWRGPDYIINPEIDEAGVGWILAENWWPYQRPTFITPPFAGYISGHSTFSRAAAEVMTLFTGDPFFPGGMGEFEVKKNEFLVFEEGPSQDFTLQWATYRDASDQTSLSRIWGGIHPPVDDIPGRIIGEKIGVAAFGHAEDYFNGQVVKTLPEPKILLYPNPVAGGDLIFIEMAQSPAFTKLAVFNLQGQRVFHEDIASTGELQYVGIPTEMLSSGMYIVKLTGNENEVIKKIQVVR